MSARQTELAKLAFTKEMTVVIYNCRKVIAHGLAYADGTIDFLWLVVQLVNGAENGVFRRTIDIPQTGVGNGLSPYSGIIGIKCLATKETMAHCRVIEFVNIMPKIVDN